MTAIPGSRCSACGHTSCPPQRYCPGGCGETMTEVSLPATGVLYSSTIIHVPHPEFGDQYQVGYVDHQEGPRLFGHVAAGELLAPDTPVHVDLSIEDDPERGRQIRTTFTPVEHQEVSS